MHRVKESDLKVGAIITNQKKIRHKLPVLNTDQAVDILYVLGCSADPVVIGPMVGGEANGKHLEITPNDLATSGYYTGHARSVKVPLRFAGVRGRWFLGTLADMVAERMGLPHNAAPCKRPRNHKFGKNVVSV